MFLKIGHRGARAYEVENTIKSFNKSVELGANAVEMDVRQSRDGELIICHDDNLKRVFNVDLPVHEAVLAELKKATGSRIITLEEALQSLGSKAKKILLDHEGAPKTKMPRVQLAYTRGATRSTTFIGFLFGDLGDPSQALLVQEPDLVPLHVDQALF